MSSSPEERILDDDDNAEAPLTMAASVVLTNLPKDATKALEKAGSLGVEKGTLIHECSTLTCLSSSPTQDIHLNPNLLSTISRSFFTLSITQLHPNDQRARELRGKITVKIRLQPIGSAPHLKTRVFYAATDRRFEAIMVYIRKKLGAKPHESLFCYVGNVFAPGLDEGVGNLWRVSFVPFHCSFYRSLFFYFDACYHDCGLGLASGLNGREKEIEEEDGLATGVV